MLYSQTMENSILFVLSMFNRLLPLDWFIGEHFSMNVIIGNMFQIIIQKVCFISARNFHGTHF